MILKILMMKIYFQLKKLIKNWKKFKQKKGFFHKNIVFVTYCDNKIKNSFRKLAEAEMNESMAHQQVFNFPSEDELLEVTNLKDVQQRIQDVIMVLSDFKKLRQSEK